MDDNALVKEIQAGRISAFEELVLRYQDNIFNLCYRFLGDHQEAEDLAQITFLKAFRAINKFRFESSFSTWLYRIGVNSCKNRLKSLDFRFKKRLGSIDNYDHDSKNRFLEATTEERSPLAALEKKQTSFLVQQAIDKLSSKKKKF